MISSNHNPEHKVFYLELISDNAEEFASESSKDNFFSILGGLFSWHGGEMSMTFKDGSSIPIETTGGHSGRGTAGGHNHDEVDVMSTDSSSSSSTDSNW